MARMKFLCDAERCIECNACVTACKNEHEVPWGINRRRVVTIRDGTPGERSISVACMHCSDATCMAVCPVDCFYQTEEGVVLHSKDLCIGCGYCFYACPFGAPQFPQAGFGSRGNMDKCTFCAGGPEADNSSAEFAKYGRNRLAEGKLPLCAEMCSTKALLGGDGDVVSNIYRERVVARRDRLSSHTPACREEIEVSIVVEVVQTDAEVRESAAGGRQADAGRVIKEVRTLVAVERIRLAGHVDHEQVEITVAIHVLGAHAHAGLGEAVIVECCSVQLRRVDERPVALVCPHLVLGPVIGDEDVHEPVIVEVTRDNTQPVAKDRVDPGGLADVGEDAITIVTKEAIRRRRRNRFDFSAPSQMPSASASMPRSARSGCGRPVSATMASASFPPSLPVSRASLSARSSSVRGSRKAAAGASPGSGTTGPERLSSRSRTATRS